VLDIRGIGSGSCPVAEFDSSGTEFFEFASKELIVLNMMYMSQTTGSRWQ
jgi:hypothetical protein